jgi:hypothetical protein
VELASLIKESDESQDWFTQGRISYEASAEIHRVIASIGRTEDVRLSPANNRLAIAAFAENKIYMFSLRLGWSAENPAIQFASYLILSSSHFAEPHGLCFLDNDHIVVCNRAADVCIFRLPDFDGPSRQLTIAPLKVISGSGTMFATVKSPGSVDSYPLAGNRFKVVVCNNHWNFVSSHIVSLGKTIGIRNCGRLTDERLCVPDGISISPDKQWIAISNHVHGEVLIYRNSADLNTALAPLAVLGGMVCPHGVKFTVDARVLVADAASQYLHVFERSGNTWEGYYSPWRSIRMLDDDTFYSGRHGAREGGIKGIDTDIGGRLLFTTHRLDVLGVYNLTELIGSRPNGRPDVLSSLCRERDESIREATDLGLTQRWTRNQRFGAALHELRQRWWRLQIDTQVKAKLLSMAVRNRLSGESLLDPNGPDVSLTTHARRLHLVHNVIEAIGKGRLKPRRIVLWLTDEKLLSKLSLPLRRLQSRGLEIRLADEFGPHSKFYPYLEFCEILDRPLVTADDDCLYNRDWLYDLMAAYKEDPRTIHAHWVMRMGLNGKELTPYGSWPHPGNSQPSHLNYILGVGGVIYMPEFLAYLKRAGSTFKQCCPTNDDAWLTVNAIRAGFKVSQLNREPTKPLPIPGSQVESLYSFNETNGAIQAQLRKTFLEADIMKLVTPVAV